MSETPDLSLRRTFNRRALTRLAGPRSFERGVLYADDARVEDLSVSRSSVRARVNGSMPYAVELWVEDDGEPRFACSCPVGQDGRFCKHAVAVAIVATDDVADGQQPGEAIDLREYLLGCSIQELVDLLVEYATADPLLDGRLRMRAALGSGAEAPLEPFRVAIDDAFFVGDFVGYPEMSDSPLASTRPLTRYVVC